MGRPADECWLHVQRDAVNKRRWKCKYCPLTSKGGITRVKAHLGGILRQQISICRGNVPDYVKRACNPQPGGSAHVEPMGQAQPSMQPHRESGNGTSQSARGTEYVEPTRQAQPSMQLDRERDNGTFQSVASVAAEGLQENRVSSSSSASTANLSHRFWEQPLFSGSNIDTPVVGALQANEVSSSCNASADLQWANDCLRPDFDASGEADVGVTSGIGRPELPNPGDPGSSQSLCNFATSSHPQPAEGDDTLLCAAEGSPGLQAAGEASTVVLQDVAPQVPAAEGSLGLQAAGEASIIPSGGADVGVTSHIGRPELPNPGDPGFSQSLCNFATSSHPQPAEAEGSPGLQAAAVASTVVLQVVVPQVPAAEGSLGLQAVGEASIIPPCVIDALQTLEQEGQLHATKASLVKGFLDSHPTMCLSVAKLTPRLLRVAYTCLADLLSFLDSHCPLDMSEGDVRDYFNRLLHEMRFFNFNSNWVTSVEKHVNSQFPNEKVVSQNLEGCLHEEKVARQSLCSLKDNIEAEQFKITARKRRLDGYIAEYKQSKANMASIRERKANALRAIKALQEPFGIRF